ncbi:CHAPERONE-LIKE PROTEIN OF chloroplastic [Micractinium conductrix]|uniref:CHAPERONE-LIKE PROTEIN OF chloroplastic n=1 Tax=Micractinium conductrix TaxID=554055 RepID=A0A2P6VQ52_9CHLO|nr:CHAPERONE-LIKE PROTEIN OF chloroplastic [Micractinium conductrix]|eukprot:PSC76228.1 CHAPERONE-LIKE PROTEIN OF chloroplastic [Micractinium conductrix]
MLTLGEAFATLGLAEGTPYEAVLAAKNRLLEKSSDDFQRRMEIEAAYDLIFSSQLRARLTGNLPVSTNVRFADVQRKRPGGGGAGGGAASGAAAAAQKAGRLLQGLPSGGVVVAPPAQRTAATVAGVYGVLAAWTLAQGLLEPTPAAAAADVPGAQLALATAATVYLLRDQKRVGLGKAAALALGGLVLGTFLGAGVQSWLRVDIIPLWGLASPGALVGEFSIAALAAVCLFLA